MKNKKEAKELVKEVFYKTVNIRFYEKRKDIKLKIINIKAKTNGLIKISGTRKRPKFKIYINIYNANRNNYEFYLYSTIMHEFEHIDIVLNTQSEVYERMLAVQEMSMSYKLEFPSNSYKRYATSAAELWCAYSGVKQAYGCFGDKFIDEDREKAEELYKAMGLILKNQLLGYDVKGVPYNKFVHWIKHTDKKDKYNDFKYIFECTRENEMYNKILLHYFLNIKLNYVELLEKNNEMTKCLEKLVNEYYDDCIEYIKNKELLVRYIGEEIIDDNLRVMLNYISLIEEYIECGLFFRIGERVLELY